MGGRLGPRPLALRLKQWRRECSTSRLAMQLLGTIKELLRSAYQNSIEYSNTVYATGSNAAIHVSYTAFELNLMEVFLSGAVD